MKKTLYLLLSILLIGAVSCKKEDTPGGGGGGGDTPTPGNYTISGTISGKDGTVLQGVVVSDGYTCYKTGADGKYYLSSDLAKAEYVFVSTPSGYSAPVKDGMAVFWKFLKDCSKGSDGKYSVDFTLNKISNPERYTVFIFADPQPRTRSAKWDKIAYHSLDCCDDMYRDMKEYAATITGRPVYGIGLGDIVHRDLKLLSQYKNGMSTTGISTYNVIGNHDHDCSLDIVDDTRSSKAFEAQMGPVNYSFNLGGMHYLMLDNMISSGNANDECTTGLTDDIWAWVKNDLAQVSPQTPLMVCAHSPMMRMEGGKDRTGAHLSDLKALISKYPKAYVWAGHTHTTFNYVDTNNPKVETHTVTRVTGALWTNEYLGANGTPRGYIVFDYDNGKISWKFKPIYYQSSDYVGEWKKGSVPEYNWRDWDYQNGKAVLKSNGKLLDDTYQMQVFPPGTYGDSYLYVNVFLWDELWDVPRLTMDGIPSRMSRITEKDWKYSYSDWDITSFYNSIKDLEESFVPSKNNNESMFRVFVEKTHGTGTVSVKDRFGNTHSSTITW